jgi:hypothetical protein
MKYKPGTVLCLSSRVNRRFAPFHDRCLLTHLCVAEFTTRQRHSEPTGSSEPPDCVSGLFIRLGPAVAEPARSAGSPSTLLK